MFVYLCLNRIFQMFLNISPTVAGWSATSDEFSLIFENNPVAEFVELPDHCYNLRFVFLVVSDSNNGGRIDQFDKIGSILFLVIYFGHLLNVS